MVTLGMVLGCHHTSAVPSATTAAPASAARCALTLDGAGLGAAGWAWLTTTTYSFFVLERAGDASRGYVLVARGQPWWFRRGDGVSSGGGTLAGSGPRTHVWRRGGQRFAVTYDPTQRTLLVGGRHVSLDTANVMLLERADSVGGPPAVAAAVCAHRLSIDEVGDSILRDIPAVRAFSAPDA